jgi:MAP/microtubule affinity-regulating kinase
MQTDYANTQGLFSLQHPGPHVTSLLEKIDDFHSRDLTGDVEADGSPLRISNSSGPISFSLSDSSAPLDQVYDGMPVDVSMSPAAMFLSAFSPATQPNTLKGEDEDVIEGYTLGSVVGRGGFSTVRRGTSPSGDVVAIKIIKHSDLTDSYTREQLKKEAAVWSSLSHEHILPLFQTALTPVADYFFMLFCPAGSLFDILRRDGQPGLPHDDVGTMFRQVVRGVRYIHEQAAIVHGDLKLENVLVDPSGSCRIGDFGMAQPISHEQAPVRRQRSLLLPASTHPHHDPVPTPLSRFRSRHGGSRHRSSTPLPNTAKPVQAVYELPQGSLPYAAPELLHPPSPDYPYLPNPAQDVWALGVMLYTLLTGRLPFSDSFEPRLTVKILNGALDPGLLIMHLTGLYCNR